jgi:nitrite reductase/ring-hydroxylating ferredoxin subunit
MSETNSKPVSGTVSGAATTRRTVLRSAGLMALAGGTAAVAGCAADNQTAGAPATTDGGPTSATSSSAATPADSPTAAESYAAPRRTGSEAPNGPSVATSSVPVGGGVILNNADYVVTQPSKGTFKAFTSICTHMRCAVAEVSGGFIRCSCHGSQFSIKDGSVANPPASQPLAQYKVTVSGGKVFVTE